MLLGTAFGAFLDPVADKVCIFYYGQSFSIKLQYHKEMMIVLFIS